jgi:chlorobactene glucosyltransferase
VTALAAALDVVGLGLAIAAGLCAWRSCRWLRARASAASAAIDRRAPGGSSASLTSLLVPARNEEANIEECVQSLAGAEPSGIEVLVLDDASEDATAERARRALERSGAPGRVITGRSLEPGWGGKSFACQQLADASAGEWLFFLDADVRISPGGVEAALRQAQGVGADFASFLPRYTGDHWGNRWVVPWLYYFLTALIPLPEIPRVRHPRLSVANGQAILVRRDAYRGLGGHAAVRDRVIEDVSLAIAAKRAGFRVALLDGHEWIACQMYASTGGLVEGFAKSFHSAAALHPFHWLAMMVLLALVGLRPWARALTASAGEAGVALATVAVVSATFGGLLLRFRQRGTALLVWPLALGSLVAIALVAGVQGLLGRPVRWRGRVLKSGDRPPAATAL